LRLRVKVKVKGWGWGWGRGQGWGWGLGRYWGLGRGQGWGYKSEGIRVYVCPLNKFTVFKDWRFLAKIQSSRQSNVLAVKLMHGLEL
jgi:hypothetical protein